MRHRLAVGVALALLVGAAALRHWALETGPPRVEPRPSVAGEGARWSAAPAADAASVGAAPGGPALRAAQPAPAASAPAVWDLCGIGRLPVPAGAASQADWPDLPRHLGTDAVDAGRQKLLAALRQGDARARAAARYWAPVPREATLAELDDAGATEMIEDAAQDPVVLRWALARCGSETCRDTAAARWADIEPDNLAPRLNRLSQASRVPDEAFVGLSGRPVYRSHWGSFAETARRAMPVDLPAYVQMALLVEAIGIDGAMPDANFQRVAAWCRPPFRAGSGREAQCDALGRVMSERGDTILAFMIGLRLRELAGFDPVQANALRAPIRELPWTRVLAIDPLQPMSCTSVAAMQRWVEAVARDGELATVRAAIAAVSPYSATPPQSR